MVDVVGGTEREIGVGLVAAVAEELSFGERVLKDTTETCFHGIRSLKEKKIWV